MKITCGYILRIAFAAGWFIFAGVVYAGKPDQRQGRQDEAYKACVTYLQANAKDPGSFAVEPAYTFKLATWMTAYRAGRNQIIIYMYASGANSYGVVSRHSYTCWVGCAPGKPCSVDGTTEDQ